jgi:hypothetical protein
MDKVNPDRFAYETFTLAFRIQRLLESDLTPQEAKDALIQDCARLKEKVDLLTRVFEDREPAQMTPERIGSFFKPF